MPEHDFPAAMQSFLFLTCYSKKEAVEALQGVRAECMKALRTVILSTSVNTRFMLEVFETMVLQFILPQSRALGHVRSFCLFSLFFSFLSHILILFVCWLFVCLFVCRWSQAVEAAIRTSLSKSGKGWFNLQERNREVYEGSKLKRLLRVVTFMMQDTLRFLTEDSLKGYASFLEDAVDFQVAVEDTDKVLIIRPNQQVRGCYLVCCEKQLTFVCNFCFVCLFLCAIEAASAAAQC